MADQKQQQQQQQQEAQPQPSLQSIADKSTPPSKGEINGSSIPSENYLIFTKIDPSEVLAYYLESCLEDDIDLLVDPFNLPDDYPVVLSPHPPPQNSKLSKQFKHLCILFCLSTFVFLFCLKYFCIFILFKYVFFVSETCLYSFLPSSTIY